jgi:uncharacterized membrane protein YedE/YeeE
MQGFGMALTGACPGTVLAQIATGVPSGWAVLAGGIFAGTIWSRWGHLLKQEHAACGGETPATTTTTKAPEKRSDVDAVTRLAFTATCAAVVFAAAVFFPDRGQPGMDAVLGASIFLTGGLLGVSSGYVAIGRWMWEWASFFPGPSSKSRLSTTSPASNAIFFMVGIVAGSYAFSQTGLLPTPLASSPDISKARAVIGGAVMIFGSQIAGGCTSGHGISGMATVSPASFVTVASMFSGGWVLSMFLDGV